MIIHSFIVFFNEKLSNATYDINPSVILKVCLGCLSVFTCDWRAECRVKESSLSWWSCRCCLSTLRAGSCYRSSTPSSLFTGLVLFFFSSVV